MRVLDLQCAHGHSFEGWFGSQADYDAQRAQGLVSCPVCSNSEIVKRLSAPRLNLKHGVAPSEVAQTADSSAKTSAASAAVAAPLGVGATNADQARALETLQQMHAALMDMVRHVMANTEDVGSQFAEEARKIHYGESQERHIRGQATHEQALALLDEGIEVMALPVPQSLKGPLH